MNKRYIDISKTISFALRHNPDVFGLSLDSEGWVSVDALIKAINNKSTKLSVELTDILAIIEQSEKKIEYTPQKPPSVLYHGTSHHAYMRIAGLNGIGLKPMGRQYVHLSSDIETAIKVGKRRDRNPVVFAIASLVMYDDGFKFYHTGNDTTWLCDCVPKRYLINEKEY